MKLVLSSLLIVCAFLTACSKDDGDKKSKGYAFTKDFQPAHKPQNAAPQNYLQDVMVSLKESNLYLPSDAAFFNVIIDGSDVKSVWDGSDEREAAKRALNNEGLRFVEDIKRNCMINNAKKTESGEARQGGTKTQSIVMSTTGNACPLLIHKGDSTATTYDLIDINQAAQTAHVVLRMQGSNFDSREVRNARIEGLSGIRLLKVEMNTTGSADITQNSRGQQTGKVHVEGVGSVILSLANGDTVQGPITMEAVGTDQSTELRFLFDGKSNQGAVRIVVIVKSNQAPEIYLNGEKIDGSGWGGVGKMSLESLAK